MCYLSSRSEFSAKKKWNESKSFFNSMFYIILYLTEECMTKNSLYFAEEHVGILLDNIWYIFQRLFTSYLFSILSNISNWKNRKLREYWVLCFSSGVCNENIFYFTYICRYMRKRFIFLQTRLDAPYLFHIYHTTIYVMQTGSHLWQKNWIRLNKKIKIIIEDLLKKYIRYFYI